MNDSEFIGNIENSKNQPSGKLIASGGTANLFLFVAGNRYYIRKVLREPYRSDPQFADLLQREFEAAQSLDHPNIIRYLYLDTNVFPPECILEYCDGVPPTTYFQNMHTTCSSIFGYLKFLRDLKIALGYLRLKKVTHSDIKPSNLLMTNEGRLKILDFGHAQSSNLKLLPGGSPGYGLQAQLNPEAEACRNTILEIKISARYFPALFKFRPLSASTEFDVIKNELRLIWCILSLPIVFLFTCCLLFVLNQYYSQIKTSGILLRTHSYINRTVASFHDRTDRLYSMNKLKSKTTDSKYNPDYKAGFSFWPILQKNLLSLKTYTEFRNERLRIIDSCFAEWRDTIIREGIEEGSTEYQHRHDRYQSGYFKAYQESENALKKL